jgi:hypothetical protein
MSDAPATDRGNEAEIWHLSADLFRRFLDLRASRSERRAVVRHLITRCPDCVALAERITAETGYWLGAEGAEAFVEGDYAQAFQAAFRFATRASRQAAVERLHGWAHWSALDPLLPHERLSAIIERKDWHHWGLFHALLDAARWYKERDPQEAAGIALLALDVVRRCDKGAALAPLFDNVRLYFRRYWLVPGAEFALP